MNTLKVFYKNLFSQTKTTGSIAPSSRFLAEAMLRHVKKHPHPMNILEAGPGTGPFTIPLARLLEKGDHVDLCELNNDFVDHLCTLLNEHPDLHPKQDQFKLYHMPVQELEGEQVYDVIITSLPFNNFTPELVQEILDTYQRVIKPGGTLSFFEYAAVRNMKKLISNEEEVKRINGVGDVLEKFLKKFEKEKIFVPLNLPPSVVHVCTL